MSEHQGPTAPPPAQPNHLFPAAHTPALPQPYPGRSAAPHPSPSPAGGDTAHRTSTLARFAFAVALVTLGSTLLLRIAGPVLGYATDFHHAASVLIPALTSLLWLVGGAVALALGLAALRHPGSRALAGIAVGIGGAGVLASLFTWAAHLIYRL